MCDKVLLWVQFYLIFSSTIFSFVSVHNFANDNTWSSFARTINNLVRILESESGRVINWFRYNSMIVNPHKIQNVKMLGVHIGSKLDFDLHIDIICKPASNQLNALV